MPRQRGKHDASFDVRRRARGKRLEGNQNPQLPGRGDTVEDAQGGQYPYVCSRVAVDQLSDGLASYRLGRQKVSDDLPTSRLSRGHSHAPQKGQALRGAAKNVLGCLFWRLPVVHGAGGQHDQAAEVSDHQRVCPHREE